MLTLLEKKTITKSRNLDAYYYLIYFIFLAKFKLR